MARAAVGTHPLPPEGVNPPPTAIGSLGTEKVGSQLRLPCDGLNPLTMGIATAPPQIAPLRPTPVYDAFWHFAAERQRVFFARLMDTSPPWTDDPVIAEFKFTNAYRASDRTSQYLIRSVIYRDDLPSTDEEIIFRVLLFKFFNRIETWELLEAELGPITYAGYSFDSYDGVLEQSLASGARDGIRKCYSDRGGLNEPEIIRFMADRQEREFARLGLQFRSLWGRPLQLIDCQNVFCEVDKYARVAYPEIQGHSGRTRIKQRFASRGALPTPWYPPKWGLNERISADGNGTSNAMGVNAGAKGE